MAATHPLFKVIFTNQGQVYPVEDLVFGERTQLVVDPSEERLKSEFEGVRRFYLPMNAVIRIDEVDKEGAPRIRPGEKGEVSGAKVTPFPAPTPPSRGPVRP